MAKVPRQLSGIHLAGGDRGSAGLMREATSLFRLQPDDYFQVRENRLPQARCPLPQVITSALPGETARPLFYNGRIRNTAGSVACNYVFLETRPIIVLKKLPRRRSAEVVISVCGHSGSRPIPRRIGSP